MKSRLDSHLLLRKIIYDTCFKELSTGKILMDKISTTFAKVAAIAIIIAVIFETLFFVIYSSNLKSYSFWFLIGALFSLIISIIFMIKSVTASRNYIKTKYPLYIKHMEYKKLSYEISVLKAIRINKLSSKNWLPISFFAVFSLPIWNAIINRIIPNILKQKDLGLIIIFFVALLLFLVLIFALRTLLTSILFKKAEEYRQLNELLKIIKESIN
ncbi:hypothetical protein [Paenibacillus ottowii]|uniref:hypothetical protein n=1 Tax=Paenibacillus ottowii TaxID=2315729 RepID=UPI003D2EC1A1